MYHLSFAGSEAGQDDINISFKKASSKSTVYVCIHLDQMTFPFFFPLCLSLLRINLQVFFFYIVKVIHGE